MKLSKNIGFPDRLLRFIIALILLAIAYWKASWILFALALFVLFESLWGWCALYQILGKNSCPTQKK